MSAPHAMLLRLDRAPMGPGLALARLLASPVRRDGAVEPGTVLYEGCAALEGVQPYPDAGKGADYAELVTVAALQASADSIVGLPVILGEDAGGALLHPGQGEGRLELVAADNGDEIPKRGTVVAAEVRELSDGLHFLWVQIAVFDALAIQLIDDKLANSLSLAYRAVLTERAGTFRGTPYTVEQTGRGAHNHLLLTNQGRGGPLVELRVDALGADMTPEDIAALVAALVAALKPAILEMVKQAMKDARVEDQAAWITDDSALAMARAIERVKMEGEEPTGEIGAVQGDAAMTADERAALKVRAEAAEAQVAALKVRAEAAEAQVAAMKAEQEKATMKADALPVAAALQRHGLTVDGFDAENPTAAALTAAKAALLEVALRADAAPRSPLDQPPAPPKDEPGRATPSTRFAGQS